MTDTQRCKIVAVDGPAGSGKSSVCAKASKRIGWTYVNTGFLYRAVAYICRQRHYELDSNQQLGEVIDQFTESLKWDPDTQAVWFQGENLTPHLYTDTAGKDASLIAKNALVREKLLPVQRKLALQSPIGSIIDGRDIGTVVFPDADLKVFMTASIDERARRRVYQLNNGATGSDEQIATIRSSILSRDQQDAARGTAPLIQAQDAILIDTSDMPMDSSIDRLIDLIRERGLI